MLLQFNWTTVILGASSLLLVGIYPFMKRITNWRSSCSTDVHRGALDGPDGGAGALEWPAIPLYAGAASVDDRHDTLCPPDKEDDLTLGLGSTRCVRRPDEGLVSGLRIRDRRGCSRVVSGMAQWHASGPAVAAPHDHGR